MIPNERKAMAKYLDLLKLILSYGDKIPEILGRVENIIKVILRVNGF